MWKEERMKGGKRLGALLLAAVFSPDAWRL